MRNKYMVLVALLFMNVGIYNPQINLKYEQTNGLVSESIPTKPIPKYHRINLRSFTYRLGELESRNDYTALNRFGYMGRYQFSKNTLLLLKNKGYLKISNHEINNFLFNPKAQEAAIVALIKCNDDYFKRGGLYERYLGNTIKGVRVTREGMLAGAHLVGPFAVKQFLKSNGSIIKSDANKTKVTEYMKQFSG